MYRPGSPGNSKTSWSSTTGSDILEREKSCCGWSESQCWPSHSGVKKVLHDLTFKSPVQILLGSDGVKGGLDMTVTLCHRYTPPEDLATAVQASDLVVSAAGVPGIITREMVKPGAVLVDVGLTRVCHLGKNLVVGDVHREARQVRDALSKVFKLFGATHRWPHW